jgi:tetratricopeptide (TPR) repeat protein
MLGHALLRSWLLMVFLLPLATGPSMAAWSLDAERCYAVADEPGAAIQYCNLALEDSGLSATDRAALLSNRGTSYTALGAFEKAVGDFNASLSFDPGNAYTLNNRAVAYGWGGQYELALADLAAAATAKPKEAMSYSNRCWLRAEMGKPSEGLADCDLALQLNPYDAIAFATRGYAYLKMQEMQKAIVDADRSVELGPACGRVIFIVAMCMRRQGAAGRQKLIF